MVKQVFRRFFCLFFALVVLFLRSVPVYASGVTQGASGSGVPVGLELGVDVVSLADMAFKTGVGLGNFCRHFMDNDVCPLCTDLTGQHDFVPKRTLIDGKVGVYYTCRYCGKFAGEVMETAYQEYVETLPGKVFSSDGSFRWVPGWSDFVDPVHAIGIHAIDSSDAVGIFLTADEPVLSFGSYGAKAVQGEYAVVTILQSSQRTFIRWGDIVTPYDGYYHLISATNLSNSEHNDEFLLCGGRLILGSTVATHETTADLHLSAWPVYEVTPLDEYIVNNNFSGSYRVSGNDGGTGLYGYIDNGTLVQSAADTIFSEGGNVYTNPVTNETKTVTSWDYDYTDRSYTLATNEGDTVTVTYGDTNVAINEGAETYNVYYLVEHDDSILCDHTYTSQITQSSTCMTGGVKTYTCSICGDTYTEAIPATGHSYSSSVTQEPTCTASGVRTLTCSVCGDTRTEMIPATGHSYSSEVTMEPTCIGTGVRMFVCSVCGDTYTVSVPATGHRWRLIRQEPTIYDENGQLVTAGYTLYQCDTCEEQYRLAAESGGAALPSPAPDSVTTSGATEIDSGVGRGFLATIACGLTEDLPEAAKAASSWFTELPPVYNGYTSFLAGTFVWLPQDIQVLLRFSVGIVTFIGIIRKIWGRG